MSRESERDEVPTLCSGVLREQLRPLGGEQPDATAAASIEKAFLHRTPIQAMPAFVDLPLRKCVTVRLIPARLLFHQRP